MLYDSICTFMTILHLVIASLQQHPYFKVLQPKPVGRSTVPIALRQSFLLVPISIKHIHCNCTC